MQENHSKHPKNRTVPIGKCQREAPPPPALPLMRFYTPLQSRGQNQKWPTCGQSGYVTPTVSGIPTPLRFFPLFQRARAERNLCMGVWPHDPWLESVYRFEPFLIGINGLGNPVVFDVRVVDPTLFADLFCFCFPSEKSWPCDLGYMPRPVMRLMPEDSPPYL